MIKEYAKLYSEKEGGFSKQLATKLFAFLKDRHYYVRSVLDIACGTGEFLSIMQNGCSDVVGIDFEPAMIEIAKNKVSDATFRVEDIFNFDLGRKFDLCSCNYESVNFALDEQDLAKLFRLVAAHLNDGGIFVFDFKTDFAINKDEFVFEESNLYDYIKQVKTDGKFYTKKETYYVATKDNYRKIVNTEKRKVWSVDEVKKALDAAGFCNENWVTYDLKVLKKPKKTERVHVLCYLKRKNAPVVE